jgi:hypothetical protein
VRRVDPDPAGPGRAEPGAAPLAPPAPPRRPGRVGARPNGRTPASGPPTRWRLVRDVLGRRTEAEIDHGGRSQLPDGGALVERYRGTVGDGPDGETWARGSAHYRIEWPEATVATSVRLDLRGDAEAFEVQLDLEAGEDDQPRWARSWRRRIPRHLT